MSTLTIGVLLFIFMLVLMAIRVPIAVAMFGSPNTRPQPLNSMFVV